MFCEKFNPDYVIVIEIANNILNEDAPSFSQRA